MPVMNVLINPVNGVVVESTNYAITVDSVNDCFVSPNGVYFDPRPSSGVIVVQMDFPMESILEYQMIDDVPVRVVPLPSGSVPESVPMLNARLALYAAGWLADVEALFAAMEGEQGDLARIYWATAKTVRRDNEVVSWALAHLGKTPQEADALFIAAAALVIP